MKNTETSKKKIKKWIMLSIVLFLCIALLAFVLWGISALLSGSSKKPDALPQDVFYEIDYSKNIFEDKAYLRLDRSIMYMEFDSGLELTENNYTSAGVASAFFYEYFDAIINGDADRYHALLTDNYIDDFEPPTEFTMQMLYDIEVNRIQTSWTEEYQGKTVTVYNFAVKYKIFQNNGTFRNDIAGNQSTTQYYQLYSYDGKFYLNSYTNKLVIPEQ